MEHYKSRNNDYFHFTNPRDDVSEFDDDDVYDDRSCDFNFHTYRPLGFDRSTHDNSQTSGVMNQKDTVELGALIFQLDDIMKNISDKLQHTIEGIGSQISHLEDEAVKIDNYVEDVKNSEERYHGTTHRKLRQMQSILQEVQDGVLFLRDKHEIAETQLQLALLYGSRREKTNIAPQSSCNAPRLNHQSNEHTFSQAVFYHPIVSQANETAAQQYVIPPYQQSHAPPQKESDLQFPHFIQSQLSNTSFIQISNPRNYKSEFHAKYMPEFASFSNIPPHGELVSPYAISNMKPVDASLHPQEKRSRSSYIHTPVAQTPPHALPTAIYVEEESRSEENGTAISVDDIVDQVTRMGFRRDLVRACVRKLTVNGSPVDLNSVLDRMMKNK
ncbi:hypothetical protein QVD17_25417 [Tagetes erecta]|uniref:DUF1421 domain-containing protein n=1 Tax=Tagetes erecta TaxID=13708 RepID=A0AAD8KG06_TARER|nr:hypothetical protein QVD17_25417 [Tagetes erecta]